MLVDDLDKFKTDKISTLHDYTRWYASIFGPIAESVRNVLEIGVEGGDSLRMWRKLFPNANIVGADINDSYLFHEERISCEKCDQGDRDQLHSLGEIRGPFDIVIDDGSHRTDHQVLSFEVLFQFLSPGGWYVIEDLHTSYQKNWIRGTTCIEFLKGMVDKINLGGKVIHRKDYDLTSSDWDDYERWIDSVWFCHKLCFVKKREQI